MRRELRPRDREGQVNVVTLVFGILLVGTGFVTLIHKLHNRSFHEALAVVRDAHGDTVQAVASLASMMIPIVSSIAGGIAFMALAVLVLGRV
jgi:hypothetical protein